MDEPISATYTLTDDDYMDAVVAQHRYLMTRPVLRLAKWLFLGFVVFGSLVVSGSVLMNPNVFSEERRGSVVVAVFVVIGLWSLAYLAHPRNILNRIYYGQRFRSLPEGSRRIEWGCDREELWSQTALAEGSFRWELFRTIVETQECFLFYQGELISLWLPAHAFSNLADLRRFAALARSRVSNYFVLGECQFPAKPESVGVDEL